MAEKQSTPSLLPCPFCQGAATAKLIPETNGDWHHVDVTHIDGCFYKPKAERLLLNTKSLAAWNTRAALAATPAAKAEAQAEPVAWMYSFTHSSAIGHGDHDIGPVVTKDRKAAFGVGCFDQQPLFTSPQAQPADALVAERIDDLYIALEVCAAELFAQCGDQGRAMKYVEQARKTLAAEQCIRAAMAAAQEGGNVAKGAAPVATHGEQLDAKDGESAYQRGYRHGYNRRDAEVQGALL